MVPQSGDFLDCGLQLRPLLSGHRIVVPRLLRGYTISTLAKFQGKGRGARTSFSDTVVVQYSPEVMNEVQLDYPVAKPGSRMSGWIYASLEVASASSVGQQVLTSIWRPKTEVCVWK